VKPVSGMWQKAQASFLLTESCLSYMSSLPSRAVRCARSGGASSTRASVCASILSISSTTREISCSAEADSEVVPPRSLPLRARPAAAASTQLTTMILVVPKKPISRTMFWGMRMVAPRKITLPRWKLCRLPEKDFGRLATIVPKLRPR
jgi:hypothetical protein